MPLTGKSTIPATSSSNTLPGRFIGRFNDVVMGQFRAIVKQAFVQYTNDYINERLKSAISADTVVENKVDKTEQGADVAATSDEAEK